MNIICPKCYADAYLQILHCATESWIVSLSNTGELTFDYLDTFHDGRPDETEDEIQCSECETIFSKDEALQILTNQLSSNPA